jgi:hypothetical protein
MATTGSGEITQETRQRWLGHLYATAPADRPLAESGVRDMYAAAKMEPPRRILWLDSPAHAAWTVLLLDAQRDSLMRRIVEALEQSRASRERLASLRAIVAKSAGASWDDVAREAGRPLWGQGADPKASFQLPLTLTRMSLWEDVGRSMGKFAEDPLFLAEAALYGLFGRAAGGGAETMFLRAIPHAYNFLWMAMDEEKTQGSSPPPFLESAWRVARSAGPWWAFSGLALLSERPSELHRNAAGQPSRGDGPAILYQSGWSVYAWNGGSMPEKWILHPESIPPAQLKQADKSFRDYLATRIAPTSQPAQKAAKRSKILQTDLPADALRLEKLRKHAEGRLPLYDRYMAGELRPVWQELQMLREAVRTDPFAADALAVAYETMRRVEANVRTVAKRLSDLGYRFRTEASAWQERDSAINFALGFDPRPSELGMQSPHVQRLTEMIGQMREKLASQREAVRKLPRDDNPRAHIPPPGNTAKLLAKLEKKAGTIPLSLRVFYEVVGAVDLLGSHPSINPPKGTICPDPLVVFPLEDVLAGAEEMSEEGDDDIRLQLAPDDIHKAGESGGEPYEIAIPDVRMDGEFLNERHGLFFVDYLRLAFRFGGFPGYEGYDPPPEVGQLSRGLIEF